MHVEFYAQSDSGRHGSWGRSRRNLIASDGVLRRDSFARRDQVLQQSINSFLLF